MYYYTLKCVLYTPEDIQISTDLFNDITLDLDKTAYLKDYKHPNNEKLPYLKRKIAIPIKHAPPTPIHDEETVHEQHGLEEKIDFRFGPIEITSFKNKKETKRSLGYGVFYFYRDASSLTENERPDTKLAKDVSLNIVNEQQDRILYVLSVPSYLTFQDFFKFLGSFNDNIEEYQFIKDYAPNKYSVLLKFKDRKSAVGFYEKYNGRRFNIAEPEISHVVYLKETMIETVNIPPNSYPYLSKTIKPQLTDMYELPTCPVCLERMDQNITGLLNNECHHINECDCMNKWGKSACSICLYSSKPRLYDRTPICFECQSLESLWICLICGNIGCGRYQEAHAYDHYRQTNHLYALEIETQYIWDYAGDGYVHRLLQQVDGGFVELPENKQTTNNGKLDQISLDYSYMLTSQLDSQRIYYEEQLEHLVESISQLNFTINALEEDVEKTNKKKTNLLQQNSDLNQSLIELKKEKEKIDKKMIQFRDKYQSTVKVLTEEKLLTKSLMLNNQLLKKDVDKKDIQLNSLNDKVKQLLSALESSDK